jgi:hypothetical protein
MSEMMGLAEALGGPPGGGPPEIDVQPPDEEAPEDEGTGSSLDFLDAAEEALHEFIRVDPDEVDRAEASKALQIVLKLKAANQTDAEKGGMKGLRRALAGGGPVG